jgi:hypothetical protein
MNGLERSHDELRAALILAGKRIRRLSVGRRDDPVLQVLRRGQRLDTTAVPEKLARLNAEAMELVLEARKRERQFR